MKRSSKLFLLASAAVFLTALAWALATQTDLVLQAQRTRTKPGPTPGEEAPKAEEGTTGIQGPVDDGTRRALERNLKAEAEARKRLDR